jgi:hypothetical protein
MHKYFFIFLFAFFLLVNPVFAQQSFTEAQCNNQGGTCKKTSLGGCENGAQTEVGVCSDTTLSNVCCMQISSLPAVSQSQCEKAPSSGGLGGECLNGAMCADENEKGTCPETGFGIDLYCCVTEETIAITEEESGIAAVGVVNTGTKYTPLEKIPFIEDAITFPDYVAGIYKVALILIVLSAVFMLIIGGFTYLTSAGNTSAISSAKHIIYGSLLGLVLALVSFIVINTINPDLTSLSVSGFTPLAIRNSGGGASGGAGGSIGVGNLAAQEAAKKILSHPNITISTGGGKNCPAADSAKENLDQVASGKPMTLCNGGTVTPSAAMFNGILAVADTGAKFNINFLAGGGHSATSAHYKGSAVDIGPPGANTTWSKYVNLFNQTGASKASCDNGHFSACNIANHVHAQW